MNVQTDLLGTTAASTFGAGTVYNPNTGALSGSSFVTYGTGVPPANNVDNVGTALDRIVNLGPVQFSNPSTPTVGNGGQITQGVTLVGLTSGAVTLNNVAPGAVNPTSNQAINGAQLYTASNSIATALGGGSAVVGGTSGAVTAPTYIVQNNPYNDVGSAIAALDQSINSNFRRTNAGIASAMAAGALSFDTAPGAVSISGSVSTFNGQSGLAIGIGGTTADGSWRFSATGSMSNAQGHSQGGGAISVSHTLGN